MDLQQLGLSITWKYTFVLNRSQSSGFGTFATSTYKEMWQNHSCSISSISHYHGRKNKKFFWLSAIAPLVSVILSTLIVYLTKADKHGVQIVRHFKGGLNPSSLHQLQFRSPHIGEIAKVGLICAIIALTVCFHLRSWLSDDLASHEDKTDGNKEMLAMGCMNIAGSLSSCYVATELLTRLLFYTPVAILASIILSALPGLIDINEACHIWKVDKLDFIVRTFSPGSAL
ncbi:hypothetical protein Leryth_022719 [Lithospermum erythrorhizon]|nr:hypothetical protein Leryth_022719 [Lithospermum erythrorhizon]